MEPTITLDNLSSKIIEVVAGERRKKLHVHAAILSKSPKLKAQVEGEWADRDSIVLSDWDEKTIARLLERLYTGNYSFPLLESPNTVSVTAPQKRSLPGKEVPELLDSEKEEEEDEDACQTIEDLANRIRKPISNANNPVLNFTSECEKLASTSRGFLKYKIVYCNTLRAHAKLYVLSDYLLLPGLKDLAYERIQEVFVYVGPFGPAHAVIADLVTLARYVYAKTQASEHPKEELRSFLTSYIAINFSAWKVDVMDESTEEGRDFVVDITRKLRQRLGNVQDRPRKVSEEAIAQSSPKGGSLVSRPTFIPTVVYW